MDMAQWTGHQSINQELKQTQQMKKRKKLTSSPNHLEEGSRSLFEVAEQGTAKDLKRMLKNGLDVNAKNEDGYSLLYIACLHGNLDVVKYLLAHGHQDVNIDEDEDSYTPLHIAALNGHLHVVEYLIVDGLQYFNISEDDTYTPLHIAAQNGHLDVAKFLLTVGQAKVNVKDEHGFTPLHMACENGHLDVVTFLVVNAFADVNAKEKYGFTPLHMASQNGHLDVVKFLVIDGHADINEQEECGYTALHIAANYGRHLHIIRFLVMDRKADVNSVTVNALTALHIASDIGNLNIVKFLVTEGQADVNARTDDGFTPLDIASENDHSDVHKFLNEFVFASAKSKFNQSLFTLRETLKTVLAEVPKMEQKLNDARAIQMQLDDLNQSADNLSLQDYQRIQMEVESSKETIKQWRTLDKKSRHLVAPHSEILIKEINDREFRLKKCSDIWSRITELMSDEANLDEFQRRSIDEDVKQAKSLLVAFKKTPQNDSIENEVDSMMETLEKVKKELECSICLEIPTGKNRIFSCQSHHLLCYDCFKRLLPSCPVCKQDFGKTPATRNLLAEKMIANLD